MYEDTALKVGRIFRFMTQKLGALDLHLIERFESLFEPNATLIVGQIEIGVESLGAVMHAMSSRFLLQKKLRMTRSMADRLNEIPRFGKRYPSGRECQSPWQIRPLSLIIYEIALPDFYCRSPRRDDSILTKIITPKKPFRNNDESNGMSNLIRNNDDM